MGAVLQYAFITGAPKSVGTHSIYVAFVVKKASKILLEIWQGLKGGSYFHASLFDLNRSSQLKG